MKIITRGSLKEELRCGGLVLPSGMATLHAGYVPLLQSRGTGCCAPHSPCHGAREWRRHSPEHAEFFPSVPASGSWSGRQSSSASLCLRAYSPPGRAAAEGFGSAHLHCHEPAPGPPGGRFLPRFASCENNYRAPMPAAWLKAGACSDFYPGSSALPCNTRCCPGTGRGTGGLGALDHRSGSSWRASAAVQGAGRKRGLVSGPLLHPVQAASALSLTLHLEQSS